MGNETVVIECSMEQAALIGRACEFYMRVRNGQFSEIEWELRMNSHKKMAEEIDWDEFKQRLFHARALLFPEIPSNAHYGVGHDRDGNMSWEMHEVIRHAIAWYRYPEGGYTVNFDEPMNWSGKKMITCRIDPEKRWL